MTNQKQYFNLIPIIKISLFDINGRQIGFHKFNQKQFIELVIDYPSGFYFITIETEDWKQRVKLIKE